MNSFDEYLKENELFETYREESLSDEQIKMIHEKVDEFLFMVNGSGKDPIEACNDMIEEGIFGSILGGLSGFALGKAIGEIVAKTLGIKKGVLYDMLTSRLVGAALGSAIGKKFL
jgi:hypothetical protein